MALMTLLESVGRHLLLLTAHGFFSIHELNDGPTMSAVATACNKSNSKHFTSRVDEDCHAHPHIALVLNTFIKGTFALTECHEQTSRPNLLLHAVPRSVYVLCQCIESRRANGFCQYCGHHVCNT